MDAETRSSLETLINYNVGDEQKHWEEMGGPANHIYTHIKRLNDWLLTEEKEVAVLRQTLYAASPFDLGSDNDNIYRNAIDSVLDK